MVVRPEIVVDLAAIRHNVRVLSAHVGGAAMMTVVKADGYGHGLVEVGRAAREAGAAWLGTATIDEALALRAAGDVGRILCWLHLPGDRFAEALSSGIDLTAYSLAELAIIERAAAGIPAARVQLKVDTGLSRGGAPLGEWRSLVDAAVSAEVRGSLKITGIFSHFACSDEPSHPANDVQEDAFRSALEVAESAGLRPEVRHLANSAAAIHRPSAGFDLVRCGIATYGLDPAPLGFEAHSVCTSTNEAPPMVELRAKGGSKPIPDLKPAMTVRAPLALIKQIPAGAGVSYGHTWLASQPTTLGLVPVGYADGIPRHASDRAEVAVDGVRRPVRGRICMDQFVVDLDGDDVALGAGVVLFGPGDQGEPTAQDWARTCGTISYEIVTRIGGRFNRRYVDQGEQA